MQRAWRGLHRVVLPALLVGAAILLAACSDEDERNTPENLPANQPHEEPIQGKPPVEESLDQAVQRIEDTLASGDCDEINELNPLARPNLKTDERCQYLLRLADAALDDAEEFKGLGAVVDYDRGERTLSVILVRDADGLYHIAFVDPFGGTPTVDTDFASQFDRSADVAINALQARDCETFLSVASRRFGFGAGEEASVCRRVDNPLLANLLKPFESDVKPERIGGNCCYAFYGVPTPATYLTLVLARQREDENLPPGLSPELADLPEGAAEYSFVDSYQTNPREPEGD